MDNINSVRKFEKKARRLKIVAKLVVIIAIVLYILGFVNMFLYDYSSAEPYYIVGQIVFIIGIVFYVILRITVSSIHRRRYECFTDLEKAKYKNRGITTVAVTACVLLGLVGGVNAIKPSLGDMGNIIDMAVNAGISFINPIQGRSITNKTLARTDGFMKGVCHVKNPDDAAVASNANIEWNREDIGNIESYNATTKEVIGGAGFENSFANWKAVYEATGMKYFCVTPYPKDYASMRVITNGPSSTEETIIRGLSQEECSDDKHIVINEEALAAVAKFYMKEMLGVVYAYQISNELMGSRFRYNNMTMEEAAHFIGIQLKAMVEARDELVAEGYEEAANIIIGYNVCDFNAPEFVKCMVPYNKYCDYVGLDLYIGCFENIMKDIWYNEFMLRWLYQMTGKPLIMCEFGYIGEGADKNSEEKAAHIASKYGPEFTSEEACKNNTIGLLNHPNFESSLRERIILVAQQHYNDTTITIDTITQEQACETLFGDHFRAEELRQHFYCIMNGDYSMTNYKHNREDQAKFFADSIPQIANLPFTIGTFVYHFPESDECYFCGQGDCPIECGWGLYRRGNPSKGIEEEYFPAYYAVQEAYGNLNQKEKKLFK